MRLRKVDRDSESADRVASPEELDKSLVVDDEEAQFSGLAWSTSPGDGLGEVAGTPGYGGQFAEFFKHTAE